MEITILHSGVASIEFKDIDKDIQTIYFDVNGSSTTFETRIYYTDDTAEYYNEQYDLINTKVVVPEVERTKYFTCHFARECKGLKICNLWCTRAGYEGTFYYD